MIKTAFQLFIIFLFAVFISGCGKEWRSPQPVVDSLVVAGSDSAGLVNGAAAIARFDHPFGLAFDAAGNLYIADQGNSVIRKMNTAGIVSTFAGKGDTTGSANGAGTAATFYKPFGVATDASGNVYVADAANNQIRKISPAGVVSKFAGTGVAGADDGTDTATFNSPLGVAVDKN
ncbi:MAG TPA: hypothetical protein VGM63_01765, partial [Mucilaginibacter sp.]